MASLRTRRCAARPGRLRCRQPYLQEAPDETRNVASCIVSAAVLTATLVYVGMRTSRHADGQMTQRSAAAAEMHAAAGAMAALSPRAGPVAASAARRVDAAIAAIAALRLDDGATDDPDTLLAHARRDDAWADAAEAQFMAFVFTHGSGLDALEVRSARCSASVCERVAARMPGTAPHAPNPDWQALLRCCSRSSGSRRDSWTRA